MAVYTLVDGATGNLTTDPLVLSAGSVRGEHIPIQVTGLGVATITIQGCLHTNLNDNNNWSAIVNAVYTTNICTTIPRGFNAIRVVITGYSSGTINVLVNDI